MAANYYVRGKAELARVPSCRNYKGSNFINAVMVFYFDSLIIEDILKSKICIINGMRLH